MSAGIKTVSLALGACFIALPSASWAQENIALDFANPNVSVDFSVLGDNGANLKAATSPIVNNDGHLIPGPKAPVSTLYITPAGNFKIAEPKEAETVETVMPQAPSAEQPTTIETAKKIEETVDTAEKDIPPAPQPMAAPEPSATVEQQPAKETPPSAPEIAKEEVAPPPEPAPIAPPKEKEIVEKEPLKETIKEVAKTETEMPKAPPPPPEPVPAPAPVTPVADAPVEKIAEAQKPEEVEPLKLEAKAENEAEKTTEPLSPPPPPPVVEAPTPPKVTAPLPEKEPESEAVASSSVESSSVEIAPAESAPSVASIPPSGGVVGDGYSMRVLFEPDTAKLPNMARDELSALVKNMGDNENLRLQLLAYAGGADMSASVARRLSLSRALAVRSYLIESGIRSTRIDVRALGNKTTDTDSERVDITVIER